MAFKLGLGQEMSGSTEDIEGPVVIAENSVSDMQAIMQALIQASTLQRDVLDVQVACELELWQEAFRSVEDIQGLAAIGKKAPKPQFMATYYAKLTRIFTVSESHLYNG